MIYHLVASFLFKGGFKPVRHGHSPVRSSEGAYFVDEAEGSSISVTEISSVPESSIK